MITRLKMFKFAWRYNVTTDYLVIPYGDDYTSVTRFLKYEDALEYSVNCANKMPMFLQPEVMVCVRRK